MATNSVNNPVFRVSYQGGDITDPNNYISTMIDSLLFDDGGDLDVVAVGDFDGDPEDEVLYTQGYSEGMLMILRRYRNSGYYLDTSNKR